MRPGRFLSPRTSTLVMLVARYTDTHESRKLTSEAAKNAMASPTMSAVRRSRKSAAQMLIAATGSSCAGKGVRSRKALPTASSASARPISPSCVRRSAPRPGLSPRR